MKFANDPQRMRKMTTRSLNHHPVFWSIFVEQSLSWVALAIVFFYTYLHFTHLYAGFYFGSTGRIESVYVEAGLERGDQLLRVGPLTWPHYSSNLRLPLFAGLEPGDTIQLQIQRDDQTHDIAWKLPGFTWREFWVNRFISQWFLAPFFWLVGAAVWLLLRPRDTRQRLFVAFSFFTAFWLIASTVSYLHLAGSPFVLHSAIWLSWPIYWHLHWVFPQPLRRLPRWLWGLLYGAGLLLAAAEWFQLLPTNTYLLGFLLALVGSLV
jgi:hypothetical protein